MGRRVAAVAAGLLAGVGLAVPGGVGVGLLAAAGLVFAAGAWPAVRLGWDAYARSRRPGRLARALPRRAVPSTEATPDHPLPPPAQAAVDSDRRGPPGTPG